MKRQIRIFALVMAALWSLAWAAAGRTPSVRVARADEEPAREAAPSQDARRTLRILHGGAVEEMDMRTYLIGVLRAEMPASFELEALKAQAIAARTYTLYKMRGGPIAAHPEADACDDIACCKAYCTAEQAAAQWGDRAGEYEDKLARAVDETDSQVICYGGEPILAVFCSSVSGYTQNAGAVWAQDLPYLQSVSSPEREELVPNYYSTETFAAEDFRARILAAYPAAQLTGEPEGWITGIERSEAGFVTALSVGGVRMRGNELRTLLGLRSPSFTVSVADGVLTFRVVGYGHGVGMSQYGANILAQQGMSSTDILEHYFTGATVETYHGT